MSAAATALLLLVTSVVGCADAIPIAPIEQQSQSAPGDAVAAPELPTSYFNEARADVLEHEPAVAAVQALVAAHPQSSVLHTVVPNRVPSVRLHALPNVDWPVLAIRHPGQEITIIARAPLLSHSEDSGWLMAEVPNGSRGWITSGAMRLTDDDLTGLRRLELADVQAVTNTRGSALIHRLPEHSSASCVLEEGARLEVAGRNLDGQWLFVRPTGEPCSDSDGFAIWRGWTPITDVEHDPIFEGAPVIHSYGLWLLPVDPSAQPRRLPVAVYDDWQSEAWSFDPEDQSLVFQDYSDPDGPALKRYRPETDELTTLYNRGGGDILVAPVGGRVLVMDWHSREDVGPGLAPLAPGYRLTIVEPNGDAKEIGSAFLYCQCDRGRFLSAQARWSPDGRAIVFRDWGIPEEAEAGHEAGEFWLYRLDRDERISLFNEATGRPPIYDAAEFHPDGRSIYVLTPTGGGPHPYVVRRLTLEGEPWPGFRPVPADRSGLSISPLGDRMIAGTNGIGLLLTDQGDLLGAHAGWAFEWLPDGRQFRFATRDRWQIGSMYSYRPQEIPISELPRWSRAWSPDGERVATVTRAEDWPHEWSDTHLVRIYDIDGRLRSTYRTTGCHRLQWLADSSRLAVSVFPYCSAP